MAQICADAFYCICGILRYVALRHKFCGQYIFNYSR